MRYLFALLITAFLFSSSSAAELGATEQGATEQWTGFRGPTGQGHSSASNLPTKWSHEENVVWKSAIPGTGWSSPILYQGRVYLTAAVDVAGSTKKDFTLRTLCLDAKNGKTIWDVKVFERKGSETPRTHKKNGQASPTPLLEDGKLYIHFGHYGTACLDLSGKILWRQTGLEYTPVHGNGGSPIIAGNNLIFSIDGSTQTVIVALDKKSGKLNWKTDRKSKATRKFSFSTPLLITVKGRQQVISQGSDVVCSLDPQTGEEIWRASYDGFSLIPRPVYGHGMIFISTGYMKPNVLAIRTDGEGDVTDTHIAWRLEKGAPNTPSLLLVKDDLYMISDGGIATCVDAKSGKAHWTKRIGGGFSASPIYADGKIYLQSEDGVGSVFKPGKTYQELGKNDLGERTLASYAVSDGAIFIRSDKHLYRIGK